MVPRSPDGPHAVIGHGQDHHLAYPRRNGDTTEWLTESEVATAYRRRFQQLADRGEHIERIDGEAKSTAFRLGAQSYPALLIVSLAPDVPGSMTIDNRSLVQITHQELASLPLLGREHPAFGQTQVGPRRIVLLDSQPASYVAELHSDGSGTWAVGLETAKVKTGAAPEWGPAVDTDDITTLTMSALRHLARHAVTRTGAAGTAAIRTRLISQTVKFDGPSIVAGRNLYEPLHLADQHVVSGRSQRSSSTAKRDATGQAHALLEDLADGGPGLVQASSLLLSDLFQHFGLAEAKQIRRDGSINTTGWSTHEGARITAWAEQAAITVS